MVDVPSDGGSLRSTHGGRITFLESPSRKRFLTPFLPDGSGIQLRTVPVGGANTVSIQFSEWTDVDIADLTVTGLERGGRPTIYGFTAPTAGNNYTARWTFDNPATTGVDAVETISAYDYYLLNLKSDSIADAAGNDLDGEWINPSQRYVNPSDPTTGATDLTTFTHASISRFPSGNGMAGGDFNFLISILPGDANLNLFVGNEDYNTVFNNFYQYYNQFVQGDLDGSGQVNPGDFNIVFNSFFVGLGLVRLAGDVNGDGQVTAADLTIINSHPWGTSGTRAQGDANGDGIVDLADRDLATAQLGSMFVIAA